jgi:hypothetical protein
MPKGGETSVAVDSWVVGLKSPYSGAGTQTEVQWQLASDAGFTSVLWDSQLRAADGRWLTADSVLVPVALIAAAQGSTVHLRSRVRNSVGETSAWSSAVSFTLEARMTAVTWAEAL